LQARGYKCVTGGTDNHIVLLDLTDKKVNGARVEKVLEDISIATNKNTVPGDKSALNPSGIRLGTPALTSRGLVVEDMEQVVEFIHQGIQLAIDVKEKSGPTLKEFNATFNNDQVFHERMFELRKQVETFAIQFPMPGYDEY